MWRDILLFEQLGFVEPEVVDCLKEGDTSGYFLFVLLGMKACTRGPEPKYQEELLSIAIL